MYLLQSLIFVIAYDNVIYQTPVQDILLNNIGIYLKLETIVDEISVRTVIRTLPYMK